MSEAIETTDQERMMLSLGALPPPVVKPLLVVVSGLPGTGKSYFSARLAMEMPFVVLESDALRKSLFSNPSYSPSESARLFKALNKLLSKLINRGVPVILDATNLSEKNREYLYSIAERSDAKLVLIRTEAPPELVRERLEERQISRASNSDADWQIYQQMEPQVDRIRRNHYVVDTFGDIAPAIRKVMREINRWLK